jgi:hypothetical protein
MGRHRGVRETCTLLDSCNAAKSVSLISSEHLSVPASRMHVPTAFASLFLFTNGEASFRILASSFVFDGTF